MSDSGKDGTARLSDQQLHELITQKFSLIWPDILLFFVVRTQKLNATIGDPIDFMIIQVVCWHHFLLNIRETTDIDDSSFDMALKLWSGFNIDDGTSNGSKRLTFVAIESLINIPFETVRRRVRRLEKRGWVIVNDATGIDLNVDSPVNQLIVQEIHPFEKQEFVRMLSKISKVL